MISLVDGFDAPCPGCGYDRRGLDAEAPCPECGALSFPREALVVVVDPPPQSEQPLFGFRWQFLVVVGIVLMAFAAAAWWAAVPRLGILVAIGFSVLLIAGIGMAQRLQSYERRATSAITVAGIARHVRGRGSPIVLAWRSSRILRPVCQHGRWHIAIGRWPNRTFLPGGGDEATTIRFVARMSAMRETSLRLENAPHRLRQWTVSCARCGAFAPRSRAIDRVAACRVCGEAKYEGATQAVGRRAPWSTWDVVHGLMFMTGLMLLTTIPGLGRALGPSGDLVRWIEITLAWMCFVLAFALPLIVWQGRLAARAVDRAWILGKERLEIATPGVTWIIPWSHVRRVDLGHRRGAWRRVRVVTDAERIEDLWINAAPALLEQLRAEIAGNGVPPTFSVLAQH